MTIRRGQPWGETVPPPDDLVTVTSDADLARLVEAGERRPIRIVGGDLLASLGGAAADGQVRELPLDIIEGRADGEEFIAVAHVVARSPGRTGWWRGPIVAVANVDHLGRWDLAPRAHPNDGLLDVVEVDTAMSVRARWQAWRRLPTGTHVPHPSIRTTRTTAASWDLDHPTALWVDGVERGRVRSLAVTVRPDHVIVYA